MALNKHQPATLAALVIVLAAASDCTPGNGRTNKGQAVGNTYDFVISGFDIDAPTSTTRAGFNFDGRFSDVSDSIGCGEVDYVADVDLDQNLQGCSGAGCQGGVDNHLPEIIGEIECCKLEPFRPRLSALLAEGRIVILMRLENVVSLWHSPTIRVNLYHGTPLDTACSQMFAGSGRFNVFNHSLAAPGALDQPLWSGTGSIVDGRLSATIANASISLPLTATSPPIEVVKLTLRATLTEAGVGATAGNAGGIVTVVDLKGLLFDAMRGWSEDIRAWLPTLANLTTSDGRCFGEYGDTFGRIGMGLHFSAVRATIEGTAWRPASGVCGTAELTYSPPPPSVGDIDNYCHSWR